MGKLKIVTWVLMAIAVQSCVVVDRDDTVSCGGSHRLRVIDLDMSPDPLREGRPIDKWLVRLRADASGECRTTLRIREASGDEVGRERVYRLRPGINEIEIEPNQRYRFTRGDHCFQVTANIAGTTRAVDAERRFCARQNADRRWTMR